MVEAIDSVEARRRSKEIRELWLQRIVDNEVSIDDVLEYSLTGDRDSNYVAAIRLTTILENLPGWSESAASSVLVKEGFKPSDTIKTLRSFNIKAGKFKRVFELPPPSFASTRPDMPAGWPWQGKLADLVRVTGKAIPALEFEGFGNDEVAKVGERRRSASPIAIPELRANPLTGEIVNPEPFWEPKPPEIPVQPEEPSIDESDIAALFGDDVPATVDESDIEAFLN